MPIACLKRVRPSHSFSISHLDPSQKIKMSSTKSKWEIYKPDEILMPLKFPADFASIKKRLRHSATKRKRSGDRGHPCLTPLSSLKNEEVEPLIKMEKETEDRHPIIQFVKATPKPRCINNIRI
jgi:hypothetical protein